MDKRVRASLLSKLLALGVLALGGCGGLTTYEFTTTAYQYDVVHYASSLGPLGAVILGNPTPAPDPSFRAAVVDAMQGRNYGYPTRYVAPPPEAAATLPAGYRVILAFGQPNTDGRQLCQGQLIPPALPASTGTLQGAFCYGPGWLSQVKARVGGFASADDPALRPLIAQFMVQLMPPIGDDAWIIPLGAIIEIFPAIAAGR